MNRLEKINSIRQSLAANRPSVGSWMQIPHASVAEIMGQAGYDWVAVDMEHGAVAVHQLPAPHVPPISYCTTSSRRASSTLRGTRTSISIPVGIPIVCEPHCRTLQGCALALRCGKAACAL